MSDPQGNKDITRETEIETSEQTGKTREDSPHRVARSTTAIPQLSRSRKDSQEFSPTRNNALSNTLSTIPSAAAVQRALSAQRQIIPPTSVDGVLESARSDRNVRSGNSSPAWPISPRLKSPPPSLSTNRSTASKKNDTDQNVSNTSLKRSTSVSSPDLGAAVQATESKENTTQSGWRLPPRATAAQSGGLETVAEGSLPNTPLTEPSSSLFVNNKPDLPNFDPRTETSSETSTIRDEEAGGDNTAKAVADKPENSKPVTPAPTSKPPPTLTKRSSTGLATAKAKAAEPARTMTVETEPVTTMPPLLVGDRGASIRDGGSVKAKPSTETIRPKKEKKKYARKAPASGTVTSKADIFEAKVASAVDEADSSDSDETFVYESNPPENRSGRHHSRTPSATSLASQEQFGTRGKHGVRSGSHAIAGKKSMKFSSGAYSNHYEGEGGSDGRGSTRNASTPRHHHIGRHGRAPPGSIFDGDSPFTQASRTNSPRTLNGDGAKELRPSSPRLQGGRPSSSSRKGNSSGFDTYEDAADDERAPLMGSVRVNRTRHNRRLHSSSLRNIEYAEPQTPSYFRGYGNCMFVAFIVILTCIGIAAFVVGLSQSLQDVSIKHIHNILTSEQEIMLDLEVEALNTNLFAITVSELDVNLFAESPYAGTAAEWKKHHGNLRWVARRRQKGSSEDLHFPFPPWGSDPDSQDDDPADSPETGPQKLLLGQVLQFDSPLVFEASPIRRKIATSTGEIRLAKPGNKTEDSGSARWERVVQHPFDLIVRGVIKYQLALSSRNHSAKISSRVKVDPDNNKNKIGHGDGF